MRTVCVDTGKKYDILIDRGIIDRCGEYAKKLSKAQRMQLIESLTKEMRAAAKLLEFEHAAYLRDKIKKLRGEK